MPLRDAPLDDKLEIFEAFWGSTAARVGDQGATGWSDWVSKKADVPPAVPTSNKGEPLCADRLGFSSMKSN